MMAGWTTPESAVLVFEVVEERRSLRGHLHYFLVDGTAAVVLGGQRAPTAFRLGDGPRDRAPLYRGAAKLRPQDLQLGGCVALGEDEWRLVDSGAQGGEGDLAHADTGVVEDVDRAVHAEHIQVMHG